MGSSGLSEEHRFSLVPFASDNPFVGFYSVRQAPLLFPGGYFSFSFVYSKQSQPGIPFILVSTPDLVFRVSCFSLSSSGHMCILSLERLRLQKAPVQSPRSLCLMISINNVFWFPFSLSYTFFSKYFLEIMLLSIFTLSFCCCCCLRQFSVVLVVLGLAM